MIQKTENVIDIKDISIDDLNPYEIMTLYSLTRNNVGDYRVMFSKEGGIWPVLVVEIYRKFHTSEEDIIEATRSTFEYMHLPSDDSLLNISPIPQVYSFVLHLLEEHAPRTSLVYVVAGIRHKYLETLRELESKHMLIDPYDDENLMILTDRLIEPLCKTSDIGEKIIDAISKIIAEEKNSRVRRLREITALYERFLLALVASSRRPPRGGLASMHQ